MKYWLRQLEGVLSEVVTAPTHWVPLTVADPIQFTNHASLVVYIGSAHIEIRPGFDPRLLREFVQALEAPC
ncbi:hypothetical protein [Paenibacillus sp. RC67]|uniref:hypothetical protein n=1 Tax=Paenibacillus sp. RC67 TaxID=3039392 RepID=UPI0024AD6317|nr:hypothetical protein [Paenibacillus sp. RC67]